MRMVTTNRSQYDYTTVPGFIKGWQQESLRKAFEGVISCGYDLRAAADAYCISEYGVKSSDCVVRYMIDAPKSIMLHGCGELILTDKKYDSVQSDWIADILCMFMWEGIKTYHLIEYVKPSWILERFNPMHERPLKSACRAIIEKFGIE